MPGETFYALFSLVADQSPLDALRALELTPDQLRRLEVLCRALHYTDLADLCDAEADLRVMLHQKGLSVRWLN